MRLKRPASDPPAWPSPWTSWREHRLLSAGFERTLAAELASDPQIDLHALLDLVDRGCPPPLAARILAPTDHEPPGA